MSKLALANQENPFVNILVNFVLRFMKHWKNGDL